jgi:hypothetical protein
MLSITIYYDVLRESGRFGAAHPLQRDVSFNAPSPVKSKPISVADTPAMQTNVEQITSQPPGVPTSKIPSTSDSATLPNKASPKRRS